FRDSDLQQFLLHVYRALAVNPRHPHAHRLLAEHFIDAEDYVAAEDSIVQALAVNPRLPAAHALRAAIAAIRDEPAQMDLHRQLALSSWENNPTVDHLIGEKLARKYRFAEAATAQRRALVLDPLYQPARIALAQDLLRLGREDEGWALAELVHQADG